MAEVIDKIIRDWETVKVLSEDGVRTILCNPAQQCLCTDDTCTLSLSACITKHIPNESKTEGQDALLSWQSPGKTEGYRQQNGRETEIKTITEADN
jgi:hypothetical protein